MLTWGYQGIYSCEGEMFTVEECGEALGPDRGMHRGHIVRSFAYEGRTFYTPLISGLSVVYFDYPFFLALCILHIAEWLSDSALRVIFILFMFLCCHRSQSSVKHLQTGAS